MKTAKILSLNILPTLYYLKDVIRSLVWKIKRYKSNTIIYCI